MSGLEKFQAKEAWRARISKQRFIERKPAPSQSLQIHQSHRFSLDIAEDLQIILEEKLIPRRFHSSETEQKSPKKMYEQKNDENRPLNNVETMATTLGAQKTIIRKGILPFEGCNETVFMEQEAPQWQRTSDESFEALEKMCNKTVSDPDSTLFKYLHSDNKEEVLARAKQRSGDGNYGNLGKGDENDDDEEDALQRLLSELDMQEQTQLENVSPLKGAEVTLLEDIEAPSRLWENTIVAEGTVLQTSPVKMVGLMRPSTITEEAFDLDDVDLSSQMSFQSALKGNEVSVSCYETAHDSSSTSMPTLSRKMDIDLLTDQNLSIDCYYAEDEEVKEVENRGSNDLESVNLIGLDKTLEIANAEGGKEGEEAFNDLSDDSDSVIELLSDDEHEPYSGEDDKDNLKQYEDIKMEPESSQSGSTFEGAAVYAAMEDIGDDDDNDKKTGVDMENSGEQSLQFNDTMEEVEYMVKKGLQYMASANTPTKTQIPPVEKNIEIKSNPYTPSPKKNDHFQSPRQKTPVITKSTEKFLYASPKLCTPISVTKVNPQKRFAMDFKPMPKLDVFKKPTSAIPTRLKEPASSKQFSHIVSPVGAYMKKTGTTPLISNFKVTSTTSEDVLNSTVFRELEYGSRVYIPKFESKPLVASNTRCRLPKKAYISSEFKHVVDERTPITIPGGKKIQKYLSDAMLPTVVRHEGKLKVTGKTSEAEGAAQIAAQRNTSLANLSVISGDISVYTMRDAQKF